MKTMYSLPVVCTLLLLLQAPVVFAEAGKVHFVYGKVEIVAEDGKFRFAKKGDKVHQGETIQTDKNASAQVRMVDGGILAIRPATQLKIDQYQFQNDDKEDRSFFGLLKGSFRSLTGLIGKRNKKAFLVRTPTSTIGIRGSDADMGYDALNKLTAVRTYTGSHSLTGPDENGELATLFTNPGQIAIHVQGQAPQLTDFFPFAMPAPDQTGKRERTEEKKQARKQQGDNVAKKPGRKKQRRPLNPIVNGSVGQPASVEKPIPPITIANVFKAPPGVAVVGADMEKDALSNIQVGNGGLVTNNLGDNLFLNAQGEAVAITDVNDNGNNGLSFFSGNAKVTQSGGYSISNASGGTAVAGKWGVWQGDFVVVDQGNVKKSIGGFHYAYASNFTPNAVLKLLGTSASPTFSYSQIGGTITNEVGALPTSYDVSATGAFSNTTDLGTITVTLHEAKFASGSTDWSGSFGSDTIKNFISEGGITGTGGCSTCTTSIGNANGGFVGGAAQGMLVGLGLTDGVHAVSGTAVLKKN